MGSRGLHGLTLPRRALGTTARAPLRPRSRLALSTLPQPPPRQRELHPFEGLHPHDVLGGVRREQQPSPAPIAPVAPELASERVHQPEEPRGRGAYP